MKIRTIKYVFKEGIINAYRNKLMFLASIVVVMASLMSLGVFLLITVNSNYNAELLKGKTEISVFCNYKLDDTQVRDIENQIKNNPQVKEYTAVTKKDAFLIAEKILGDNKDVLEGIEEDFLPVSFKIKLKDINYSNEVAEELKSIPGVDKVKFSQKEVEFIQGVAYWLQVSGIVLIVILLATSVLIISNTIKIAVFSRRKEINIMKYIGATDWFIRWPFIVEGVIIGFVAAVIAFVVIRYGYGAFLIHVSDSLEFIKFLEVRDIEKILVLVYISFGVFMSGTASIFSIRKHLRV